MEYSEYRYSMHYSPHTPPQIALIPPTILTGTARCPKVLSRISSIFSHPFGGVECRICVALVALPDSTPELLEHDSSKYMNLNCDRVLRDTLFSE
jgi:hypothetical protein